MSSHWTHVRPEVCYLDLRELIHKNSLHIMVTIIQSIIKNEIIQVSILQPNRNKTSHTSHHVSGSFQTEAVLKFHIEYAKLRQTLTQPKETTVV